MKVASSPAELERRPRTVAIGTFDGVHVGHQAVVAAAVRAARGGAGGSERGTAGSATGGAAVSAAAASATVPTVVTFDPHPREVLGYEVELLITLERRLELLAGLGVEETLVVQFTPELAALPPEEFARTYLAGIGAELVVAGESFRFGLARSGDLALLTQLGLETLVVPLVPGISSTGIRQHIAAGDVRAAAPLLGRPVEVEGIVVSGDARGGTLGFPTANLRIAHSLLVPGFGIYAGAALEHRAAVSIGINPHYGGAERRIEAFLLDFEGDLYGQRVIVELWERLRDEAVFESEAELIAQIARDVDATRAATRP